MSEVRRLEAARATSGARAAGSSDEAIECAARAGAEMLYPGDFLWTAARENFRELWRDVARAVLAAAPPTPSAPGVAALLAECCWRQEFAPDTGISCDEIVRLLAPEGTDDEGEGT